MIRILTVAAMILALITSVSAQPTGAGHLRDLAEARAETAVLAEDISRELAALVPIVPGWQCEQQPPHPETDIRGIGPLPSISFTCVHLTQRLNLRLVFEASSAEVFCQVFQHEKRRIAAGRVAPDLFRFFENDDWQIMRRVVSLTGCSPGGISFTAKGGRSDEEMANGVDAIDVFAEAMLEVDPSALPRTEIARRHTVALGRLVEMLEAQSHALSDLIPVPDGWSAEMNVPFWPEHFQPPVPNLLAELPAAGARLLAGSCRISFVFSAGPITLSEARYTNTRRDDGFTSTHGAYMVRNTDRFVGRETLDGRKIEVLLDGWLLVRVVTIGSETCETDPQIVRRLFDSVLETDFSAFRAP